MVKICQDADKDVVSRVLAKAESGELKNFIEGKYESWGNIDLLAYRKNEGLLVPGTSVRARTSPEALGKPELVPNVEHQTKPVGTREAVVPRGYLIPAGLGFVADKLRMQNVKVEVLAKPVRATGVEFIINGLLKLPRSGYQMVKLEGGFSESPLKEFPAGTFRVDLAQPLANLAFYCLEPQAADGFVGWNVLTEYLESIGAEERSVVYPIYKYFKIME